MSGPLRYCATPDHVGTAASKWPSGVISWTITDSVPGIADDVLQAMIAAQLARWAKAGNFTFTYTDNARAAQVLVTHKSIDGPEGILAETELPQPGLAQVHLWFDTEAWVDSESPGAGPQISIDIVGLHELGHALGLGHRTDGGPAIMDPVYNPAVSDLEAWDIQQIQALYGPPTQAPVPAPRPAPGSNPASGGNAMSNAFVQIILKVFGAQLQQWISDGSLAKFLQTILTGLASGQITTTQHLASAAHDATNDHLSA